jgi:hypothetical protein
VWASVKLIDYIRLLVFCAFFYFLVLAFYFQVVCNNANKIGCNLGMSGRESDGDLTVKARDF